MYMLKLKNYDELYDAVLLFASACGLIQPPFR